MNSAAPAPSVTINATPAEAANPAWLELVAQKVKNLRFGSVQIIVHDAKVVQIERTERHRFDSQR